MKVILASGSPRRKELLEQIGMEFEVVTSNAEENTAETEPGKIVMALSALKSDAVVKVLENYETGGYNNEEFVVIGADTIVFHNGAVYGKPVDYNDACRMIASLAGETHQVYTGVTLSYSSGSCCSFYEKTDVSVFPMTDKEIKDYVDTEDSMDKAGAYGIQGPFAAFVKGINGDYNNVVGLPVARLYHQLKGQV